MTTLGIIPARGGSKRFPGKNLSLLAGKPLLQYSIESCLAANKLDRLVVSSDDEKILAIAEHIQLGISLRRPAHLAEDKSLVIDTIMDVLSSLEVAGEGPFDIVALVQCTSPLTLPIDIDGAINELSQHKKADSAATVMELEHHIHPAKLQKFTNGWLVPIPGIEISMEPSYNLEKYYVRNGSVYVSRRRTLENGKTIGDACRGYLMPFERSVDINTHFDLEFAEFLLSRTGK